MLLWQFDIDVEHGVVITHICFNGRIKRLWLYQQKSAQNASEVAGKAFLTIENSVTEFSSNVKDFEQIFSSRNFLDILEIIGGVLECDYRIKKLPSMQDILYIKLILSLGLAAISILLYDEYK